MTFLVQRERVIQDVNERLNAQVAGMQTVANVGLKGAAADVGATTAQEDLDPNDYTSVAEYLEAAVGRLVAGRNEASVGIIDGVGSLQPVDAVWLRHLRRQGSDPPGSGRHRGWRHHAGNRSDRSRDRCATSRFR